jgi:hypothetical protein
VAGTGAVKPAQRDRSHRERCRREECVTRLAAAIARAATNSKAEAQLQTELRSRAVEVKGAVRNIEIERDGALELLAREKHDLK